MGKFLRKNRLYLQNLLDELALNGAKKAIDTALELERDEFLARMVIVQGESV